jgi:hypothetical protein
VLGIFETIGMGQPTVGWCYYAGFGVVLLVLFYKSAHKNELIRWKLERILKNDDPKKD